MSDPVEEKLLARLRALPPPAPDQLVADRTRLRARSLFLRLARHSRSPWLAAVGRVYGRAEPGLAAGMIFIYLAWALQTAAALLP
jgi:hypothetical protein